MPCKTFEACFINTFFFLSTMSYLFVLVLFTMYTGALMLFGFLYSPNYTRLGGFVGKYGMK